MAKKMFLNKIFEAYKPTEEEQAILDLINNTLSKPDIKVISRFPDEHYIYDSDIHITIQNGIVKIMVSGRIINMLCAGQFMQMIQKTVRDHIEEEVKKIKGTIKTEEIQIMDDIKKNISSLKA